MTRGFDPDALAQLDEPVRRYFAHALAPGAPLSRRVRIEMRGRIKVGAWLGYRAEWEGDGRSFVWRARAGVGRVRPLHVVDRYAEGTGAMDVRLMGRISMVHAANEDVTRSAAGRAAGEAAVWAPASLLPERGVTWRVEAEDHIVAAWDVAPERPEVHVRIGEQGAVRSVWLARWSDRERAYVPFGVEVRSERAFGPLVLADRLIAGWWHGTPRWDPFFEAEVLSAAPID